MVDPTTGQTRWVDQQAPGPADILIRPSSAWNPEQPIDATQPTVTLPQAQPGGFSPVQPTTGGRRSSVLIAVGVVVGLFLVLVIIGAIVGSPKPQNTAATISPLPISSTTSTPAPVTANPSASSAKKAAPSTSAAPAPPPIDPAVADAKAWIARRGKDANAVQVSMQAVQAGVILLQQQGSVSAVDVAQFSQLAQQSHDFIQQAAINIQGDNGGPNSDAKDEAFQAAWQLQDAMNTLVVWLDNQKPSELAKFMTNYQQGTASWNDAVTKIWGKAVAKPPTV
jgi:hypothetical protein